MKNKKTSTLQASIWAFANSIGTRGLSFLFFVMLSRALSPLEMGVMALALSVSYIADTFADAGLSESIIRADSPSLVFLKAVTTVQVSIAIIFTVISYLVAPYLSLYFKQDITLVLPSVLLTTVINAVGLCPQAILKKGLRFKEITVRNIVGTLIGGIVGLLLAYKGSGVWSLVAMNMANALTGTVICCISAKWFPTPTLALSHLNLCARFALGMTATRVLENTFSRADQFVVGSVFGAGVLGLYSLAVKLYDVLFQIVCAPFSDVFFSKLSSLVKDNKSFTNSFIKFLSSAAIVGPPIFTIGGIFISLFATNIFGAQWSEARLYILIILVFGSFQSIAYIHSVALVALGLANARFKLAVISISLWFVTIFFLVHLGPIMAAVTWAFRIMVLVPLQIFILKKYISFSLKEYFSAVIPGVLGIILALCPYGVYAFLGTQYEHNLVIQLIVFGSSIMIFGVVIWFSSFFARELIKQGIIGLCNKFKVKLV